MYVCVCVCVHAHCMFASLTTHKAGKVLQGMGCWWAASPGSLAGALSWPWVTEHFKVTDEVTE